jgi:hypothetical protein
LVSLMSGYLSLLGTVNDSLPEDYTPLSIYRWRPRNPDWPGIYNWIFTPGTFQQTDLARWVDFLDVATRIMVYPTDEYEESDALEVYADAFRNVVDFGFRSNNGMPLGGVATEAHRTGMRIITDTWDREYLGIEFPIRFKLARIVHD